MSIIVTRNAWNKMRNILSKATNQEGFLFSAKEEDVMDLILI